MRRSSFLPVVLGAANAAFLFTLFLVTRAPTPLELRAMQPEVRQTGTSFQIIGPWDHSGVLVAGRLHHPELYPLWARCYVMLSLPAIAGAALVLSAFQRIWPDTSFIARSWALGVTFLVFSTAQYALLGWALLAVWRRAAPNNALQRTRYARR
jgi:hypothetical protein